MSNFKASSPRSGWVPALGALWALAVGYGYLQKVGTAFGYYGAPFSLLAPSGATVFHPQVWIVTLEAVGTAMLVLAVTLRWGARLGRFLGLGERDAGVLFGAHFALGMIFLDLLWFSLGVAHLWWRHLLFPLGGLLALEAVLTTPWGGCFQAIRDSWRSRPRGDLGILLLILAGLLFWGFTLLKGLLPEVFYDSMVYHLAVPSAWVQGHGIGDLPGNFFSNYPFGGELFFFNGLYFQGTEAAILLHVFGFLATALTAAGWVREAKGPEAGGLTLGLVLTLPLFVMNAGTTQVEALLALPLTLCAYCVFGGLREERSGRFLACLFGGGALAVKYTSALALAALGTGAILEGSWRRWWDRGKGWAEFLGAGLVTWAPWVLKNAVFTKEPFFPYGASLFGGRALSATAYHSLWMEQQGRIAHGWESLMVPWKAVVSNPDAFNFVGPIALAFLPAVLLTVGRGPARVFGRVVVPVFFVLGFLTTHILRFLSPGFVWIYVLFGLAWEGEAHPGWRKALAWAGALSAVLCFGFLAAISGRYEGGAGVWTGFQSRADYLMAPNKITSYYSLAQWVNANTPDDSHLLIVGDARGLYYDRPFLSNSVFDGQELALLARSKKDAAGIRKGLLEKGIDDLVVNGPEGIRVAADYGHYDLTSEEWERLDDFIQRYTEPVHLEGLQGVYRLLPDPKDGPRPQALDLLLFFSGPASRFVKEVDRKQWLSAREDLDQAVRLYPFSGFWKEQKRRLDEAFRNANGVAR
ncbi:MAG TPA: glycosyltransferase family 39 protein [bacterium]|nr:glycosyltransferase family 39 protein [bacterium]